MRPEVQYSLTQLYLTRLKGGLDTLSRYEVFKIEASDQGLTVTTRSVVPEYMVQYLSSLDWVASSDNPNHVFSFYLKYED